MSGDITEAFIRSLGRALAEQEADDLRDCFARGVSAALAEQDRANRSRSRQARLQSTMAQMGQLRAAAEAKYGPLDLLRERMMARPGMRSQLMMRASFYEWPEQ